ncbi:hypothetical protein ACET3Z_002286 [Daucus carota]
MEIHNQIAELLSNTLSPDGAVVHAATDALDRLSQHPSFSSSLLSVAAFGGDDKGRAIAAATYLKNYIRKNINTSKMSKEFRDAYMRALFQVEPAVLKVLVEGFRVIVDAEFVKNNSWPELIPELQSVIRNSNLIIEGGNTDWKTINALTVLHSLIRPFQYFLNPKVAREPVPPQLELIAGKILVPLLPVFHHFVEKALSIQYGTVVENEKILLIISKCIYFAVRSHMPSTLESLLPSLCKDFFVILNSLRFDGEEILEDGYLLRLKTGKRSLLIFCALVTRHRKFSDKLMPDIIECVSNIVKKSVNVSKLDFLSERIVSLAFDVISRVLETGPGWRLVSPHFSSLLSSAIFPAVVMNEKDIAEWEEDPDEFIRKNLPSDVGEISGFREDLFSARKSALNLLGVISISKGPPVAASVLSKRKKGEKNRQKNRSSMGELLVMPFLSKFPMPTDTTTSATKTVKDYCGVLMAYGSLVDFLGEQKPGYTTIIIRNRILPLYKKSASHPYLVATASWVLGEFSSCLPEDMSSDVYSSLLKALASPNVGDISCYPVRVSAAGAIAELVENEYLPPEWLPVLQVIVSRIGDEDEESSILFQLLSTLVEAGSESVAPHIPDIVSLAVVAISKYMDTNPGPWSQTVEQGFAALAVMAQCWEASEPEEQSEIGNMWGSGRTTIATAFSDLLQQAWLRPVEQVDCDIDQLSPPSSCIDDISALLTFIMQDVNECELAMKLKVPELMLVWASLISDWHAWEEMEDLSIFTCIKEVVNLNKKFTLKNFIVGDIPSPPAPPVPRLSVIEGISAFISEAFSQYPSAISRASACVHALLHVPTYSYESESVKQSLVRNFSHAAFSHFREIQTKPCSLWPPLLLAISSCFLCYPDIVVDILEKNENDGFTVWASALAYVASSKFEPGLSSESEIKLAVLALGKLVEQLLSVRHQGGGLLGDCFVALIEASLRLKVVQDEDEEEDENVETGDEDDDEDSEVDSDEESEDEREETEEEFLERCAEAAAELEDGTLLEEGDVEDHELEIELGILEDIDPDTIMKSLVHRHHQVLASVSLSQELITSFLAAFPDFQSYLQQPLQ